MSGSSSATLVRRTDILEGYNTAFRPSQRVIQPPAMSATTLAIPAFWREATPEAKRSLAAASLGWMLDAIDVMLYSLVLAHLIRDFGITPTTAGSSAR